MHLVRRRSRSGLVAGFVSALALSGCTAIGFGIGALVDSSRPPQTRPVARDDVEDMLKPGDAILVQLWDGRTLRGKYGGLSRTSAEDYARRYDAARSSLAREVTLPALGPGARLVSISGQVTSAGFSGIGPGSVLLSGPGGEKAVRLRDVATLTDASGQQVSGQAVAKLVDERRLPTTARVVIDTKSGQDVVDFTDVASVSRLDRPQGGNGKKVGALIGLAVDVAVVAVTVHELNQPWNSGGSTTTSSCPLIDSFDGQGWVLDAEPLGGAVYRAAERSDLVRLDHVAETGGRYLLRIRNDQDEIDHIDALTLRVADHDAGTELVPDASGGLHQVRTTVAPAEGRVIPTASRDRASVAVASLVSAADGDTWVSDPWGRDPSVAEDLRDGIELAYPRPAASSSALLVARCGATPLGPRLLHDVLALQGRELGLFYARLDTEPAVREAFERAREREVLPTVRVFDGRDWRVAGYLRDLPSLVQREQALPLDLRGIPGETLRLRVDGPPGLWSLDRAVVSFDAQGGPAVTTVALATAVADDGRDVTELLRRRDGRRVSLRPRLDGLTLDFPAPPLRPGRKRTVLVETAGYYNVVVRSEAEPQREAFSRLVSEPGGVARFVIEHLRRRHAEVDGDDGELGVSLPSEPGAGPREAR